MSNIRDLNLDASMATQHGYSTGSVICKIKSPFGDDISAHRCLLTYGQRKERCQNNNCENHKLSRRYLSRLIKIGTIKLADNEK